MSKRTMQKGDYVLATKYSDGCPRDHFCIGFFDGMLITKAGKVTDRHMVIDNDGKQFRANGFRRCERISQRVGDALCNNIQIIEQGAASVWYWRRHPKQLEELGAIV